MPCRFDRQRLWYHRILLESTQHAENAFVTLTFADLEKRDNPDSLDPRDVQLWLKRFRKISEPKIRYFAVGEYGDKTSRPHYHAIIFGRGCKSGPVRQYRNKEGGYEWRCDCNMCSDVRETWPYGFASATTLTTGRMKYIAKYTLKKMTSCQDLRLEGRHPEFARMSLVPGLGAAAMNSVASEVTRHKIAVPVTINHGQGHLPLGRYLRKKIAKLAETEVDKTDTAAMRALQAFAFENSRSIKSVCFELFSPYSAALENKVRVQHEKAQT